jgi:periplasmic mercuric ion binding protein
MRRLVPFAALALDLLGAGAAFAAEQTVQFEVANMSCAACAPIVRKTLGAVPGVTKVTVSVEKASAIVTFDDQRTSVRALLRAVTNAGYPTKLAADGAAKTQ